MSLIVKNFGCRLNALEGDQISAAAQSVNMQNTVIINSCAVTKEAVRQTRQSVRKAARENPDHKIIVTGCAAHTHAAEFAAMPEVTQLIGNQEKLQAASYTNNDDQLGDIMAATTALPIAPEQAGRARAFVQIQTGCDHRCTFCIIPYGRGNSRSVASADIVAACTRLYAQGHQEIVLTGVDITSWGADTGDGQLGDLMRAILKALPELPRLRLSSIDAVELAPNMLDMIIHEPRLMPHLHLSLQAGDDMILKRMKRRHSRAQAIEFCTMMKTKRPDIIFGADLIAGFPTETDEMFENSRALITDCDLTWLHVFPFSPRPNTPAARMPQVPRAVIKQRADILRRTGDKQKQAFLKSQIGKTYNALIEKPDFARGENFAPIRVKAGVSPAAIGEIVRLKITGVSDAELNGEMCA